MNAQLSPDELAQLVEFGGAEAYRDLFQNAPPALNLQVEQIGSAVVLVAPTSIFFIKSRDWIRAPRTGHRSNGCCCDCPLPGGRYPELRRANEFAGDPSRYARAWLEKHNVVARDRWVKVYRSARIPIDVATDLRIEQIEGSPYERPGQKSRVQHSGMPSPLAEGLAMSIGQPGWQHYLAWDGQQAVAASGLVYAQGVGWLGAGGTLPSHRRRGAQGALMARRIQDSAAAGCEWVITETGEDTPEHPNPSFHNMRRTGFQVAYLRPNYMLQTL